ncbi:MAG TPA: sigma-70 family RNA polymerase sigma factor [Candidatus Dormibacteraeota bacterium]
MARQSGRGDPTDLGRLAAPADAVQGLLGQVFREEAGRVTASLTRRYGNFELAEDCAQEAFVTAIRVWPERGIPSQPGAWLQRVAERRLLDRLRRDQRFQTKAAAAMAPVAEDGDDRLQLMFACCHPALSRDAQVALTLRVVAGLTTAQIARAFLISEAGVAQRITRAKRKIVNAGIPLRLPTPGALAERLAEVLAVLYLMFNEGYLASTWEGGQDRSLAEDATWLAGLAVQVLPADPELLGLLALFKLQLARSAGRFAPDGALVLLADQDRSTWDQLGIREATELLERAAKLGNPGPYQLQAAIASCHALAPSWAATDWLMLLRLYDRLLGLQPSPVVRLNRAVALWHVAGAEVALHEADGVIPELGRYHLLHSTRAELLTELGRTEEARSAWERALELTLNPAERRYIRARMDSIASC